MLLMLLKQIEITSSKTKELGIMLEICKEAEELLISSDKGFIECC